MLRKVMCAGVLFIMGAALASAAEITVRVENLAPANGTFLTPMWVGFHNGSFDIYDRDRVATVALERLAEDGNTGLLSTDFAASGFGSAQGTIMSSTGIPPFAPGEVGEMTFTVDPNDPASGFFSYATMVIPSNDAFIANGNPMAHRIFDAAGNFIGADFIVIGEQVLDAGTEVNDELPMNTAFFGQAAPNTGADQNELVMLHEGFLPPGSGGILNDPMFANANFLAPGYQVARITIIPEPGALALLALGGLLVVRRR